MTRGQPTLGHLAEQVAAVTARAVALAELHADAAARAVADRDAAKDTPGAGQGASDGK